MKRCVWTIVAAAAAWTMASRGLALERDAVMIDTLGVVADPFDGYDGISGTLWGETAIASWGSEWALLFGGQYGTFSPHRIENVDYWELGLGLKYSLPTLTSAALTAHYGQYDLSGSPEVRTGRFALKQRLLPADSPMSPFLTGAVGMRSSDAFVEFTRDRLLLANKVSSELFATAGAGCDVSMTEDLCIVLQAVYSTGEHLPDGWIASIGMMYYWK